MFNFTGLLLIMVAVVDAAALPCPNAIEPQTAKPNESADTVTCSTCENPSLSTGPTHGNTKNQGSHGVKYTEGQLSVRERSRQKLLLMPIHDRFRLLYLFLRMNGEQRPEATVNKLCPRDEYSAVFMGFVSIALNIVVLVIVYYFCTWYDNYLIRNQPEIQRPKIHVPQERKLNVRPRGM